MKTFELKKLEQSVLSHFVIKTQKCFEQILSDAELKEITLSHFVGLFEEVGLNVQNLTLNEVLKNFLEEERRIKYCGKGISDDLLKYSEQLFTNYLTRIGAKHKGLLAEKIDEKLFDKINKTGLVNFHLMQQYQHIVKAVNLFMYLPVYTKLDDITFKGFRDNDMVEIYLSDGEFYLGYVSLDRKNPNTFTLKDSLKGGNGHLLFDLKDHTSIDIFYRNLGVNNFC